MDHKDILTDYTRSKHALRGTKETRDFDYNNPPHNLLCLDHKYYFNLLYWIQTRPKLGTKETGRFFINNPPHNLVCLDHKDYFN